MAPQLHRSSNLNDTVTSIRQRRREVSTILKRFLRLWRTRSKRRKIVLPNSCGVPTRSLNHFEEISPLGDSVEMTFFSRILNSAPIRVRGCSGHPAPIPIGADGNGKPGAVSERHTPKSWL